MDQQTQDKINKYFDVADQPVKEWIALYLESTIEELFVEDNSHDVTTFEHDGKVYTIYLDICREKPVEKALFDKSKNGRIALDTVIKAVNTIFGSVASSIKDEKQRMKMQNIHPSLEPEDFCFRFIHMHTDVIRFKAAEKKIGQIVIRNQKHEEERKKEDPANLQRMKDLDEEKEALIKNQIETMKEFNQFKKEEIDALICESEVRNAVLFHVPRLYICVVDDYELSDGEQYMRLPVATSRAFRDENEETEVEKLKKAHNVD